MMTAAAVRKWCLVHTWSSLICTLFLLVVCITGLPLIFIDEISDSWRNDPTPPVLPADAPLTDLDALMASAVGPHGVFPGETVRWLSIEDDKPEIWFGLAPAYDAARKLDHVVRFDSRTGTLIRALKVGEHTSPLWIGLMFKLHTDWFAGLYGELFLAAMALLFIVAMISGAAVYGPYMKQLRFGDIRRGRSSRTFWLDLHNLLGISLLVWAVAVGATGFLNQLSTPLYDAWRRTELQAWLTRYQDGARVSHPASVQAAYDAATRAMPGRKVRSVRFPDDQLGSPHHYLIWVKGDIPLTSRVMTPVLVDAKSGEISAVASLPWYLVALQVSRPLHFGDYAGMPLKLLWGLLDLGAIMVLISGLKLWWRRRGARRTTTRPAR